MKKKKSSFLLIIALMFSDLIAINVGLWFSFWLRFYSGFVPIIYGMPAATSYISILPVVTILLLFIMRSYGLYVIKSRLSIVDETFLIIKSMSIGFVVLVAGTFVYREFSYSRGIAIISWFVLIFFITISRFLINKIRFLIRITKKDTRNLLIIGTGNITSKLIGHIGGNPHWDYKICGIVSVDPVKEKELAGIPVVGDLSNFSDILSHKSVDVVILTVPSLPREKIFSLIVECEKKMIEFKLVADLLGMVTSQVDMLNIDGVPLLSLKESPLSEWQNRFIKGMMDTLLSLIGLILLLPLFVIIAIVIKCTSQGPVFYMQKRIGEDNRRFTILKFRTMQDKAEKGIGPVWAKKDDARRTVFGSFLRKHNLDELPQLINVLKGEMSLVGPRPERPHFVGKFKEDIPRYMARHKIKSGLTGWAQANRLRGNTSIEERTKYDIYYVENWSLFLDIKILLMSVLSIFSTMEDAY